ncbi:hypothetical protein E6W39_24355 [Kitasatospora acidiphila]|uniref:Uncharacterized protein n=1 Tax=Kitasatospora acidiphila TaxID=2567942 RepID=A0A540W6Y7_9ACTN|nr:hypothetical protein [Kitasatospora acidiphila]TQF04785.1 hypothetical protein E6W39_24355 [Kitasatospora acidiphila]
MTHLMYRVTATGSRGSRYGSDSTAPDPQALADQLAADTCTARPDLAGPLTIHVWAARDDEHYRLPTPTDAQRFDYPVV